MLTSKPKGTSDFLPEDTRKWHIIENVLREICEEFNYDEIRTPIFEHTELFQRGVGDTTDIVNKEMYTFMDKGDRSITLRPEATASTARAVLEHKLYGQNLPLKLYYMGPMFRYERPQKGRFRQFHQFRIEAFGSNDPMMDAEVIGLAMCFYQRLGLKGLEVRLNSVGCPVCREEHKKRLQAYLTPVRDKLCPVCQERYEKNPLRIFDCKSEECQELLEDAPTILDCLCDDCKNHFEKVKVYLTNGNIPYNIDPRLVRGLDYYTNTAFEILVSEIGAKSAICGGGRYNGLIQSLGGNSLPGVGFALGMERIFSALESQGIELDNSNKKDVYIIALGDDGKSLGFPLLIDIRRQGIKAEMDYMNRSLKAQMKAADRVNAKICVIIGEDEIKKGTVIVRDMKNSAQVELKLVDVIEEIKKILAANKEDI